MVFLMGINKIKSVTSDELNDKKCKVTIPILVYPTIPGGASNISLIL